MKFKKLLKLLNTKKYTNGVERTHTVFKLLWWVLGCWKLHGIQRGFKDIQSCWDAMKISKSISWASVCFLQVNSIKVLKLHSRYRRLHTGGIFMSLESSFPEDVRMKSSEKYEEEIKIFFMFEHRKRKLNCKAYLGVAKSGNRCWFCYSNIRLDSR